MNCELCNSDEDVQNYEVKGDNKGLNNTANICTTCRSGVLDASSVDVNHWFCLNEAMWSENDAVKVLSYRLLSELASSGFGQDMLEMMYLEDDVLAFAKDGMQDPNAPKVLDSNGVQLQAGDSVTIIKDLEVKGAGFTAKRGTMVRGISLVPDNPQQIEGRVNGVKIVLLSKFLKKS